MKKNLLVTTGLLFLFNLCLPAANRYWVGGTGSWNDASHWASVSGGTGGASLPTAGDDAFFDENSVDNAPLSLTIAGTAKCHDLIFSENLGTTNLSGTVSAHLEIFGSLSFSHYVQNNFRGELVFKGSGTNTIDFRSAMPYGDVHFAGDNHSNWNLNSNLFLSFTSKIIMEGGTLNASNRLLQVLGVQWTGSIFKSLDISNSKLVLAQSLDESGTANSSVTKTNAHIYPRSLGGSRAIDSIQTVVTPPLCNPSSDGSITVTVFSSTSTGPFQFAWTGGSCGGGCAGNPLNGVGAGSYLLTVTDLSDFEQYQQFVQVVAPNPIGANFIKHRPKCFGNCNGSITATVVVGSGTAPYTYSWSTVPVQTTATAVNLCAGIYTLTVTDAHNCSQTFIQALTQPVVVSASPTSTNLTCNGICNGTATSTPTGGNVPTVYTFAWTSSVSGFGTQTTQSISGLCAGTYSVTVKDDSLCSGSGTVTITEPPPLVITPASNNISCNGACDGTISLTPVSGGTPGYSYAWTPAGFSGPSLTNLCPGPYSVTVSDANSCTRTANFNITQPAVFTVSATAVDVTCFGLTNGSVTATVAGGTGPFVYTWTPGPVVVSSASTTNTLPAQGAGTYTISVKDAHNCIATTTVTINQPTVLVANPVGVNITCFGMCNGTVTSTPTGGTAPYSYVWGPTPPPLTGQGTPVISNLCPGTYSVTVTDSKTCTSIQSVTITQPPQLTLSVTKTDVTCNGFCNGTATATPGGGTPGYIYSWSGPGALTGQGTPTLTGLCPGIYTITVTDAKGCSKTQSITITEPNVLNATLAGTVLLCNGDCNATITSTVSGGTPPYNYSWGGGQTTPSITNQCAGTYTLTVTDARSCVKIVTIVINQPTALTIATGSTNVGCFGMCNGTASAIAGGGTPGYIYSWSPGGQSTPNITGLCPQAYTVTVHDLNGCVISSNITITSPPQLFGNPSVATEVSCSGLCDASVTSSAAGGTPPYSYNWSGTPVGDGTPTITNLCAGNYSLVLTDFNNCISNQTVNVIQPTPLTAPITGSTSSCNVCNGTATVTAVGGTPPYSYSWSNGQSTPLATGLCPNSTYTVTVTDAHLCTAQSTVTISQTITITITTSNTTLSCFAACDGIATANAAGGQAPYNFLWVGVTGTVGTTQTVTGLCAGTYTVTVVDFNGCLNTDTVTFTNPPILDVTATHTNASCGSTCDGTATATGTGGTLPYSYSWNTSPVQNTQTATGLCAGTYIMTIKDGNNCTDTVSVIITEPPPVVDNPTINDANCLLADGSISVAAAGGTGTLTYVWSPGITLAQGQGTPAITGLLPGAYTLTITDGAGCSFTFNYLISNINGPTTSMAHTNVSCFGACNGTATVTASGGAGGFTYNWNGTPAGDLTPTASALCGTATYTITVSDAAGCITLDTATIFNPTLISPHQVVVNESCGGSCNGSITLAPTGGTGSYTYAWTSPTGSLPAVPGQTNLCAGIYTVIVTDGNGCDTTLTITITSPPMLTLSLASTNVLCNGACNGTATGTAAGGSGSGYSYNWGTTLPPSIILPNVVNLCPGQYILTVTDGNGCSAIDTADITEPVALTTSTTHTDAHCNAVCDGTATVIPAGGTPPYFYLWTPGAATTPVDSFLCAGNYNVTVRDNNGCLSSPPTINIAQPGAIVPNVTFTNPTCNGFTNGTATAAPTGGTGAYSYNWTPGNPPGDGTPAVTGLGATTYSLMVTDSMGCSNSQNVTLIAPPTLIANPTSTSPTCMNSCNGSATASPVGGTSGYTYSWSPGGAITQTISSLCPSVYTVIVTDANSCKDTQTVVVVNPSPINIAISSSPANCGVCDGTITVTPVTGTSPYTYVWSPAPTIGQGTAFADSVCAGLYNVTVTDFHGCDSTFTIAMNNSGGATGETVSTVAATCNAVCNGSGSIVPIGGTPPFSYLWNDAPPTANDTAINLCANNYFVRVTDSNMCVHFSPVTITQPAPILSNATVTSAVCSSVCNGVISLAASGGTPGYTYVWSGPGGGPITGQGTPTVTGLCPGTYTVNITDANLCNKIDSFIVNQSAPLTVTIASTNISCSSLCNGTAYVTITSGTAPYLIQWSDPSGQTNDTATALCAGNYTVMVKDANGCTTTLNTTIIATPAVAVNATITDATCGFCDGTATAAPSGGTPPYSLAWSNGQTSTTATSLCAGLYTVNITDNAGCTSSFPVPVSNASGPTSLAITSTNITCNGVCNGAVTGVTPTGGTAPYSYHWITGGLNTPTLSSLCAGVYFIQVTDANGCSIVDSVTITEPAPIVANQVITAATCGVCDGTITIAPSGGTAPYTVLWNTSSTALSLTNLCAGVYSVQITDGAGCVVNIVIPLNNQNAPSLSIASTNVLCNAVCSGTSTVSASGGLAPYIYLWNDVTLQTTPNATSLCAGNYAVTVTGANGCTSVATVTITEPPPIDFSLSHTVNPLCNGDSTGSITVIPSGGTLAYSYAWAPSPAAGQTGSTASNLFAGAYTVTVTDGNGCVATQSNTLVQTTALTISSAVTNPSCSSLSDGAIDVTVGGGTSTYTYAWSGSSTDTTQDLSAIGAGTYTINVTDGNGCTVADTSTLVPTQSVAVSVGNDTTFCQNGSITLSAVSATGTSYQWFELPSNTNVGNASSVTVTPPTGITSYYVVADNGSGCTASDTIMLTSNVLPVANAGSDITIVIGTSTMIGGSPTGSSGTTILWNPLPGLDNATASNPTAAPLTTTTYTVTVTTPQGCSASDSMLLTVRPTIVIPDGISPNADGDNDEWIIDGIDLFPNCLVEVYNRWGELLFQSPGYKEHWKGTYKGKDLPVGTYYYIIDLKDPLFPDVYTGPITILR